MTLSTFIAAIRRFWLSVLACVILGVTGAGIATATATKQYQASSTMIVSVSSGKSSTDVAQGAQYAMQQMTTYAGMVTSASVLDPVIHKLNLNTTAEDLAKRVSATTPTDTLLVEVSVTDTDPARAADVANAVGSQFSSVLKDLAPAPGGAKVVAAHVLTPAVQSPVPTSPSKILNLSIGLLGGLAVGSLIAAIRWASMSKASRTGARALVRSRDDS